MIDYKAKPFYLSDGEIAWVKETLAGMSLREKLGQVFCMTGMPAPPEALRELVERCHPGAYMYRAGKAEELQRSYAALQEASRIPLLLPCNLESGGNGIAENGTFFARPMGAAATGEREQARRLGLVCGREGGAVGCNWAFAPIVDIDYNWRNPITNVRTFGSDPDRVLEMALAYLEGLAGSGFPLAACVKHFPGDGVDERDHHLLPSVNSLSAEAWRASYGRVYRALIEAGVHTVMAGHILQPELTRAFRPGLGDGELLPASHNHALLTGLLRGELGFNGLIATDATPMVGFSARLPRSRALPAALMAGADMLLFCKDPEEDFRSLLDALDAGELTLERLDEAVARQLALKAALGLPRRQREGTLVPRAEDLRWLGCPEHAAWAAECADKAVTLVKDTGGLLPLSPARTRRVRLTVLGEGGRGGFGDGDAVSLPLKSALERAGFLVSLYDYETLERGEIFTAGVGQLREKFDLSIVAANVSTGSNYTSRRLDWVPLMAADAPWYCRDIPTVLLSFCSPYHLADAPYIGTAVNCYSSSLPCVEAAVEKLTGKSPFRGVSPADPFCGMWDARL